MAELPEQERKFYKRYLESGEIEDVSADTLRRAKRKVSRQTIKDHVADDDKRVVQVTAEQFATCNLQCEQNVVELAATNQEGHASTVNDLRTNDDSTQDENITSDKIFLVVDQSTQCDIFENDDEDKSCNDDNSNTEGNIARSLCSPRNFQDFISNEDFLRIVSTPVDKKPAEIFLMVLKFSLCNKLPFNQISNLLKLINAIFSVPILPETKYILDKLLNPKDNVEYHGICPNCGKYIGKLNSSVPFVTCSICSLRVDLSKPSLENIFVTIDPSEEIQNLVNQNDTFYDYVVNKRESNLYIRDIFDGKSYRSFVKNLPENERSAYLTAILNTDGAPRFECSSYSIWPVYLIINELPINVRLGNASVCAMWFGIDKPPMYAFLEPLVSKLNELSSKGIECKIIKESRLLKLYVINACVDSVARAPMQGVKQFNGKFGCNWCLHKGEWFEGSQRYPVTVNYPQQRTMKDMISFMKIITDDESGLTDFYGVKYVSPLINLKGFDIVKGFVPDYMHCCLLGIAKQITEYFLSSISKQDINLIDKLLTEVRAPRQLSRLSKSINDRRDWKAKEWENFILHYSLPVFQTVLQTNLLKYWTLFVESLFTLLKHEISIAELDIADKKLHEFYVLTQEIFSKKAMTYNVHQLIHLSRSVLHWGPLWSHSTFPFESANHYILQAIHCAKGVNLQIVRYVNFQWYCNFLENYIDKHASPKVTSFCKELTEKKIQKSYRSSNITYLGNSTILNDETMNKFSLSINSTEAYTRAVINQCLYASKNRKNKRSDNSYCQLRNGTIVRIIYFAVDSQMKREITLCHIVRITKKICDSIFLVQENENDVIAVNTNEITGICVFMEMLNLRYISLLPNLYN